MIVSLPRRTTSKTPNTALYLVIPHFWEYLNSQVRINKMVNSLNYHHVIDFKNTSFHISMYFLGLYLSPECLYVEFSLKPLHSTICGENLWGLHSEKMYWLKAFVLMPLPTQNLSPSSCHRVLGRRKYTLPQAPFFQKSVSRTAKRGSFVNNIYHYSVVLILLCLLYNHDNLKRS